MVNPRLAVASVTLVLAPHYFPLSGPRFRSVGSTMLVIGLCCNYIQLSLFLA